MSKGSVLTGGNVAVRLAMGETEIVTKMKTWLEREGICIAVFNKEPQKRSKTIILVKNLPAGTESMEIKKLFEGFGVLGRVLVPPSGVTGGFFLRKVLCCRKTCLGKTYYNFQTSV